MMFRPSRRLSAATDATDAADDAEDDGDDDEDEDEDEDDHDDDARTETSTLGATAASPAPSSVELVAPLPRSVSPYRPPAPLRPPGALSSPSPPPTPGPPRLRLLKPLDTSIQGGDDGAPGDDLLEPGCCHPAREAYRLHFLVLLSSLSFASYFCYDIPSALEDVIKRELDISTASFALLYSAYCVPNVLLGLVLGLLVDKYVGVRRGVVISAALTLVGHVLLALGGYYRALWIMCIGRLLFGIGGEALAVMQNVFIVAWFRSKELKLVFAVTQTFSRVGSVLNLNLTGLFADQFGLVAALLVGALMCLVSLVNSIIIAYLDWRAERMIDKPMAEVGDEFISKDLKKLPRSYWVLIAALVLFYAVFLPFIGLGTEFFRYKYPDLSPGTLVSMPYLISLVGAPVFGALLDSVNFRIVWAAAALALCVASFFMMSLSLLNPYIPMVMLGFAYSVLVCTLWPMVAMLVPPRRTGTAYGTLQSLQNLLLTLVPPVYGYLFDHIGYMWMLSIFGTITAVALVFVEFLLLFNFVDREGLNGATPDEKARAERASRRAARRKGGSGGVLTPAVPGAPGRNGPVTASSLLPPAPAPLLSPLTATPLPTAPMTYGSTSTPLNVPGPSPLDLRKRYMTRLGIGGPESYKAMPLSAGSTLR